MKNSCLINGVTENPQRVGQLKTNTKMSRLFSSSKRRNNGSVIKISGHYYKNNDDACFQPIAQLDPLTFDALGGSKLLISLNVPDTWCDKAGDGAWFAISVNNKIQSRGVYYVGKDGQRVPTIIQAVVDVDSSQKITVKGMWCNESGTEGRNCCIGEYSEVVLSALLVD